MAKFDVIIDDSYAELLHLQVLRWKPYEPRMCMVYQAVRLADAAKAAAKAAAESGVAK